MNSYWQQLAVRLRLDGLDVHITMIVPKYCVDSQRLCSSRSFSCVR
jgi:hypothetical protein